MRDRAYFRKISERFGFLPSALSMAGSTGGGAIWLHAVSVGEVLSAVDLLRQLRAARPSVRVFVSTTTLAGRALAEEKLTGLTAGVFFAPIDYRSFVRRALRTLRPSLVVILETEIWPNLYRETKRAGASLIVVNGRISDSTLPRYQKWSWFFRAALQNPDSVWVQTEEDARRFRLAGAPPERVYVGGNLKYDFKPPEAGIAPQISAFLERTRPQRIWIAASTTAPAQPGGIDEDDAVIAAFQEVTARIAGLLLILAPRQPARFEAVAAKLSSAGVAYVRRSNGLAAAGAPSVLLLDSMGELAALFERADVVFMGGTLASRGGHNILEPAFFGKPVIVGPHMENFAAIAEEFHMGSALKRIDHASHLGPAVLELMVDPGSLGTRARAIAQSKRGVTAKIAQKLWNAFDEGIPNPPHKLAARLVLTPLSWLWRAGHQRNLSRAVSTRRTLSEPVISIGGIAMGGVGKSPLVAHLAGRLREAGRNPAILTRGYKRREPGRSVVLVERGHQAPVWLTGDEAQIFIRAGDAHVGVGQNRFVTGQKMEAEFAPDIFLLDDGFQHWKLARKHDIVLIDALDPLAGGVFPLGSCREPLDGISRASAIVISHAAKDAGLTGLLRLLRRHNPTAPVFRSRVAPCSWVDLVTGVRTPADAPPFRRVAAFCGLGNPRSFWKTLEDLGLQPVYRWVFGDHHPYKPAELHRLAAQAHAAGAEALVTTEKDMINLCESAAEILNPLRLHWLEIGVEIDNEQELLRLFS